MSKHPNQFVRCYAAGQMPEKRVDRSARIVYGVAIATKGPAIGHGEHLDDESLSLIVQLGNSTLPNLTGSLKARMDHPADTGGKPSIENPLGKLLGKPVNFRREGDVVRADIQLLSAAAAPMGEQFMSIAEEAPETIGASLVFNYAKPTGPNPPVRFTELFAVDFVDFPATNPNGLFSAGGKGAKPMATMKAYERDGKLYTVTAEGECELDLPAKWGCLPDEEKPKEGEQTGKEGAEEEETGKAACKHGAKVSATTIAAERQKAVAEEREYRKGFHTAMTAASLSGKAAQDFETKFYGRPLEDVKFLASHAIGERAKPVGEGTGGGAEQTPEQKVAEVATKRFAAEVQLRRAFGVHVTDPKDAGYQFGLQRYIAQEQKWAAEHPAK